MPVSYLDEMKRIVIIVANLNNIWDLIRRLCSIVSSDWFQYSVSLTANNRSIIIEQGTGVLQDTCSIIQKVSIESLKVESDWFQYSASLTTNNRGVWDWCDTRRHYSGVNWKLYLLYQVIGFSIVCLWQRTTVASSQSKGLIDWWLFMWCFIWFLLDDIEGEQ